MSRTGRREEPPSGSSDEDNLPTPQDGERPVIKIVHQNVNTISAEFNFNQVGLIGERFTPTPHYSDSVTILP